MKHRAWIELALPVGIACLFAAPARAADGYLVVALGLDAGSDQHRGFAQVAEEAARFHEARLVAADPGELDALREELAGEPPEDVLFVVPPELLDVNLHRRILLLSAGLDGDPFPDFAFGYLTARDAEGLAELWRRTRALHERGLGSRQWIETAVTSGMKSAIYASSIPETARAAGFEGEHLYFAELGSDPDVLARVDEWLPRLEGAAVIAMTGNGDPQGIWIFDGRRNLDRSKHWPYEPGRVGHDPEGEMPRIGAARFRALELASPVVWSGTCHSAATQRVYVEGDIVSTFGRTDCATLHRLAPEESLCLSILDAGAVAFLAPIAANHGMSVSRETDFALVHGASLGEAVKSTWDDVFLQARGRPGLAMQVAGEPHRRDASIMQGGGANRVLIGDPALSPFTATPHPLERVRVVEQDEGRFVVELAWQAGWHASAWDMYGTDRERDWRMYARVPLEGLVPADAEPTFRATVAVTGADGEELPHTLTHAVPETWRGRRYLHLQANAGRMGVERQARTARFTVFYE